MTDLNAGQPALLTTVSLTDFIAEFGEGLLDSLNRSNPPVYAGAAHPGRQAVMAGLKRTPWSSRRPTWSTSGGARSSKPFRARASGYSTGRTPW